ncbi:DUF2357 domain-containing protein [Rhizobium ruizarguesonis]|uniref:DUF2357 domain-containing protein n=1 Tax=Rhizobium ruizarguesonis TaxID=2081791 RepID=UPI00102FAA45|nr:DUF2357 domain-containing protein [Rhizobium ruizarguesonis]TBA91090.1 DUF2357 domain-containing protein [Rhizobium ruizarguesonis]
MVIPLHRIQFRWENGFAIDLEWTKGRGEQTSALVFPRPVVYAEIETDTDLAGAQGIPPICYRDDSPALFEPLQLRENTDYFVDLTVPVTRDKAETEIASNPGWPFSARLSKVFQADPARRWRIDANGKLIISGIFRIRNHAGILDLKTPFGNGSRLEVVCQKIGYLEEFKILLDQVSEEFAELLLQYDSPVSVGFNVSDLASSNDAGLLFQLRQIMASEKLPSTVDEIAARLSAKLYARRDFTRLENVEEADLEALATELDITDFSPGGPLHRFFGGYTPRQLPVQEQFETTDTAENRYVKYFLEEILLLSTRLRDRMLARSKSASAREAAEWITTIEAILDRRIWRDIGPFRQFPSNSQVLQKARGYRDLLKYDLSLRMALELPWKRAAELATGTDGDVRPVSELYEYWCFFKLRKIIAGLCQTELVSKGTLVQTSADGLKVSLRRGTRSRSSFVYRDGPEFRVEVNLYYNRRFRRPKKELLSWLGSYSANFDPDSSVEVVVKRDGLASRHWLHFDAKYRLDWNDFEKAFDEALDSTDDNYAQGDEPYERELSRIHKQDDIFKMHTYRDGILGSRGAYILYPGDEQSIVLEGKRQNLYVRHPSAFGGRPSMHAPSIGAFSLAPGRQGAQSLVVEEFLRSVFHSLSIAAEYQEEHGFFPSA